MLISAAMGDAMLQVAFLTSFAAFPWVVKPLYGFLSDTLPIFGYRRRSYLIICGLLGIICLLCPLCASNTFPACMLNLIQAALISTEECAYTVPFQAFADRQDPCSALQPTHAALGVHRNE